MTDQRPTIRGKPYFPPALQSIQISSELRKSDIVRNLNSEPLHIYVKLRKWKKDRKYEAKMAY